MKSFKVIAVAATGIMAFSPVICSAVLADVSATNIQLPTSSTMSIPVLAIPDATTPPHQIELLKRGKPTGELSKVAISTSIVSISTQSGTDASGLAYTTGPYQYTTTSITTSATHRGPAERTIHPYGYGNHSAHAYSTVISRTGASSAPDSFTVAPYGSSIAQSDGYPKPTGTGEASAQGGQSTVPYVNSTTQHHPHPYGTGSLQSYPTKSYPWWHPGPQSKSTSTSMSTAAISHDKRDGQVIQVTLTTKYTTFGTVTVTKTFESNGLTTQTYTGSIEVNSWTTVEDTTTMTRGAATVTATDVADETPPTTAPGPVSTSDAATLMTSMYGPGPVRTSETTMVLTATPYGQPPSLTAASESSQTSQPTGSETLPTTTTVPTTPSNTESAPASTSSGTEGAGSQGTDQSTLALLMAVAAAMAMVF
ncbi:uncharacterized protein BCR38DRAFT_498435 [Pseudomassariella vexata]|uniref:Uncharacterized protein n=1 Tax=Pseudomassariella vexata TaxID=1141098 RepID=A0A1Y2DK71_9PEZI|nr:uncharacterized protein BCR38DRAFT_498435 [Pseudomassariella vexata]ORY59667.1 hypothetical protein BCR38DRAFT_498435 [Pseudomassariella vexata]